MNKFRAEEELENLLGTELSKETSELVSREEIPDSPFTMITTVEGSFIVMGNYRVSEVYKEQSEAIAHTKTWDFMFNVVITLLHQSLEIKTNN